ncbi:MAG TPA: arabinofuranosidase catalytic domain-containing protein, partial [Ktedonobacteraceae bacterium]|nr:arabinofuranosidase catalytic domain-containing protein [Ktedonobacteraceae bacterium]
MKQSHIHVQYRHARRWRAILALIVATSLMVATLGMSSGLGMAPQSAFAAGSLPCDIYASYGTPCVTAHSTIRALFAAYNGPLYQIQRASDGQYLNIGLLSAGGYANAASQVSFCANTTCTITKIYDQTANHNDLPISWGGYWKGPGPNGSDVGANAMALPLTVAGHQVYGVKVTSGVGYRIDNAKGVPTGSQPEGVYMVTSSNDVDQWCCFDYGSGENSHTDTGNATMNAIEWGTACWFGGCVGSGPWVEADLENGMYSNSTGPNQGNYTGVNFPFVSAWEKNNGTSNFTLKYGNAQAGSLTTGFSGSLPNGYSPMRVDSSILLGTGGDNSTSGVGEFFEGAVTSGYPSDAAESAVQGSIVGAGYGSGGSGSNTGVLRGAGSNRCLDVPNNATTNGTLLEIWDCNGGA